MHVLKKNEASNVKIMMNFAYQAVVWKGMSQKYTHLPGLWKLDPVIVLDKI